MFIIYYVSDAKNELTEADRKWAERTKARGKIRYFGFSAH
jgi:hypothetical protein